MTESEPRPESDPRVPFTCGEMKGFRYAEFPAALEAAVAEWIDRGEISGAETILPRRAFRWRNAFVKVFPKRHPLTGWFRTPPAVRSAELSRRIRPVLSPAPWLALGGGTRAGFAGLLVTEFVEGQHFPALWPDDQAAVDAFTEFLAGIARQGILLGDFHPLNAIWDGARWVLVDLDGIRHALHGLNRRKLIERQWARTWLGVRCDPALRPHFERFLVTARISWNPSHAWARIEEHARRWGGGKLYAEAGTKP